MSFLLTLAPLIDYPSLYSILLTWAIKWYFPRHISLVAVVISHMFYRDSDISLYRLDDEFNTRVYILNTYMFVATTSHVISTILVLSRVTGVVELAAVVGWSDQIFLSKQKIKKIFPDSSYYKKYNGSCFMYLCEILSKLQMFKVTNFMTFSDGLLICVILLINHTFNFFLFSPGHNH